MRTTTLNGMLSSLATNYNRRNKAVRLYEIGKVYLPKALPLTELPDERTHFTLGMCGAGDFFDMKGVVEEFFENPDGTPITFDTDYFGGHRGAKVIPGPFAEKEDVGKNVNICTAF